MLRAVAYRRHTENHVGAGATTLHDRQLAEDRIDRTFPPTDFAARYRLRAKPEYVRLRRLGRPAGILDPFGELTVRADELAAHPPDAVSIHVVENEITYLALPPVDAAVVILGGGYALAKLEPLHWLHERALLYWGDIDSHGSRSSTACARPCRTPGRS